MSENPRGDHQAAGSESKTTAHVRASTVRVITIDDPWAALVAAGLKPREGRDTRPRLGWLFIHQSSRKAIPAVLDHPALQGPIAAAAAYRRPRHVIALVRVDGFHEAVGDCCGPLTPRGRYHWHVNTDLTALSCPVFAIGRQSLWIPEQSLLDTIVTRNPEVAARLAAGR